jgi:hypothetical protein
MLVLNLVKVSNDHILFLINRPILAFTSPQIMCQARKMIMYKYNKRGRSCLGNTNMSDKHETMFHGNVKLLINITMFIYKRQCSHEIYRY